MLYIVITALVIFFDQFVKHIVRTNMVPGESFSVIGDFFRIHYIENDGAAFGFFSGQHKFLMFIPVVIMVLILVFILTHRRAHPLLNSGLALILAGGIGNLIDRFAFGSVTDMLSFSIFPPIFNVADIAVTAGCVMAVVYVLFSGRFDSRRQRRRRRKTRKR